MINVLLGVIGLLLLGLLYTCCKKSSFGTWEDDNKEANQHKIINTILSESKQPYENHLFLNSEFIIGLDGHQSLVVEYDKSYSDVVFTPNVDWVKVINKSPNLILQVLPYNSDGRREAVITAKYGEYSDSLIITQKK